MHIYICVYVKLTKEKLQGKFILLTLIRPFRRKHPITVQPVLFGTCFFWCSIAVSFHPSAHFCILYSRWVIFHIKAGFSCLCRILNFYLSAVIMRERESRKKKKSYFYSFSLYCVLCLVRLHRKQRTF